MTEGLDHVVLHDMYRNVFPILDICKTKFTKYGYAALCKKNAGPNVNLVEISPAKVGGLFLLFLQFEVFHKLSRICSVQLLISPHSSGSQCNVPAYVYTWTLINPIWVYAKLVGNGYAVFVFISKFRSIHCYKRKNLYGNGVHRDTRCLWN